MAKKSGQIIWPLSKIILIKKISSLPQADGEDAEQADDDAENCHKAVAFAEADGGIQEEEQ